MPTPSRCIRRLSVFRPTNVSVAARSQAEVGLGLVAEKQHLPRLALAHYRKVLYEYDPNHFDPYWVERAGEYAARICEDQQQWDQAVKVYKRVLEAVPSLAPVLEKKNRRRPKPRWKAAPQLTSHHLQQRRRHFRRRGGDADAGLP